MLDTNAIVREHLPSIPGLVSAVVLQELAAGARDEAEVRRLGLARTVAEEDGVLLTPDGEDWYQAGRVLKSLAHGQRSWRAGRARAIDKGEQQRLLRDVLIARSAKRVNATVVTYNRGDFDKIRRFCNVRVVHPEQVL